MLLDTYMLATLPNVRKSATLACPATGQRIEKPVLDATNTRIN